MPIQGSEVSGSNMSMPSVRTKKYSKKSPKNMNGKRKSICGEVQAQLEPVSGIIGTHKFRPGEMKKSGVFSFGESIIQANGDSITNQGHTVDSWDRERKKHAIKEIFGNYPPVNKKSATGVQGQGPLYKFDHIEAKSRQMGAGATAESEIKTKQRGSRDRTGDDVEYDGDDENTREGEEMSLGDLREILKETTKEMGIFYNNVWMAIMTLFTALTPSQVDSVKLTQADKIKRNPILKNLIDLASDTNTAMEFSQKINRDVNANNDKIKTGNNHNTVSNGGGRKFISSSSKESNSRKFISSSSKESNSRCCYHTRTASIG